MCQGETLHWRRRSCPPPTKSISWERKLAKVGRGSERTLPTRKAHLQPAPDEDAGSLHESHVNVGTYSGFGSAHRNRPAERQHRCNWKRSRAKHPRSLWQSQQSLLQFSRADTRTVVVEDQSISSEWLLKRRHHNNHLITSIVTGGARIAKDHLQHEGGC